MVRPWIPYIRPFESPTIPVGFSHPQSGMSSRNSRYFSMESEIFGRGTALGPGLPQAPRRILRRHLVDVDAPYSHPSAEAGGDLQVPVVVVRDGGPLPREDLGLPVRARVEGHLERWVCQGAGQRAEEGGEETREVGHDASAESLFVLAVVLPRQDPGLERGSGRVRGQGDEVLGLADDALLREQLLPGDVAVHAATLVRVILPALTH